jgi:hypothetical protein
MSNLSLVSVGPSLTGSSNIYNQVYGERLQDHQVFGKSDFQLRLSVCELLVPSADS